jgi:hypothetical protein
MADYLPSEGIVHSVRHFLVTSIDAAFEKASLPSQLTTLLDDFRLLPLVKFQKTSCIESRGGMVDFDHTLFTSLVPQSNIGDQIISIPELIDGTHYQTVGGKVSQVSSVHIQFIAEMLIGDHWTYLVSGAFAHFDLAFHGIFMGYTTKDKSVPDEPRKRKWSDLQPQYNYFTVEIVHEGYHWDVVIEFTSGDNHIREFITDVVANSDAILEEVTFILKPRDIRVRYIKYSGPEHFIAGLFTFNCHEDLFTREAVICKEYAFKVSVVYLDVESNSLYLTEDFYMDEYRGLEDVYRERLGPHYADQVDYKQDIVVSVAAHCTFGDMEELITGKLFPGFRVETINLFREGYRYGACMDNDSPDYFSTKRHTYDIARDTLLSNIVLCPHGDYHFTVYAV